jgi:hypothetical protein
MNRRFKKPIALFTSVVALSATALAMFAVPASASPNPCQDGCNLGTLNVVNTPPGSDDYINGAGITYELGLRFHVNAPGTVNAISFYVAPDEVGQTDSVSLTDETTSAVLCNQCVSITPGSSGFFAAFVGPIPVLPGHEYVGSYGSKVALGYNSRTFPPTSQGTLVGDCGTNSGAAGSFAFAGCGTNQDYGVNVQFYQQPDPVMTATRVDSTHASLAFADSGDAGTTYSISCAAPGAPTVIVAPPTVGLTSPQTVTLIPGIVYTCTTTATSIGGTGTESVTVSVLLTSGPGCTPSGTVDAPQQISAASQAFPGAVVSWAPVATDCLSGYLVTPSTGSPVFVAGHGTTTLVQGPFAFGSTVGFTVAAVTGAGVGPQSVGVSVTIGTPATVTHLKATRAGKGAIKVSFKAGSGNGAKIKSFTATCGSHSATGKASPLVVKGLTKGKTYTCTVSATNSRGKGASARSNATRA